MIKEPSLHTSSLLTRLAKRCALVVSLVRAGIRMNEQMNVQMNDRNVICSLYVMEDIYKSNSLSFNCRSLEFNLAGLDKAF